jgi:hypothetical protein
MLANIKLVRRWELEVAAFSCFRKLLTLKSLDTKRPRLIESWGARRKGLPQVLRLIVPMGVGNWYFCQIVRFEKYSGAAGRRNILPRCLLRGSEAPHVPDILGESK